MISGHCNMRVIEKLNYCDVKRKLKKQLQFKDII